MLSKKKPEGLKFLRWAIEQGFVRSHFFTPEVIYKQYKKKVVDKKKKKPKRPKK